MAYPRPHPDSRPHLGVNPGQAFPHCRRVPLVEGCWDRHLKSANFCCLRFNPGRGFGPGAPQRDAQPDILHPTSHTEQEDRARRPLRVVWRFCEGSRERGVKPRAGAGSPKSLHAGGVGVGVGVGVGSLRWIAMGAPSRLGSFPPSLSGKRCSLRFPNGLD